MKLFLVIIALVVMIPVTIRAYRNLRSAWKQEKNIYLKSKNHDNRKNLRR